MEIFRLCLWQRHHSASHSVAIKGKYARRLFRTREKFTRPREPEKVSINNRRADSIAICPLIMVVQRSLGPQEETDDDFWKFYRLFLIVFQLNESPHDKTNKMDVRPAKTQISLGIRPDWSESLLSAWRNIGSLATHWAPSKGSDQTGPAPRLISVLLGATIISLVLSWGWLKASCEGDVQRCIV